MAVLATGVAVVAVLVGYVVARAVSGALVVNGPNGATDVSVGAVVFSTLLGAGAAWVIVRLARRTSRPTVVAGAVVVVGLVLSSIPPVTGATTTATAVWLLVLHALVAVPLVLAIFASVRPAGTTRSS